jgi:4-hydroxy-3-polyprenylbenzoate decarboxylase
MNVSLASSHTAGDRAEVMSDLRAWLDALDRRGELQIVRGADWNLEIGALCELWGVEAQALLFDDIVGHPPGYRVLTNATTAPSRVALAFGLSPELDKVELIRRLRTLRKEVKPMATRTVSSGPVLENVIQGSAIDLLKFPTPWWHERDGGRYIGTADAVIQRDPDSGWVNFGTYRVEVHDERTAGIFIAPGKHGRLIMEKYWDRGQACPVAVSVGPHPLLFMLAGTQTAHGQSELEEMGGWIGRPVDVVETPTFGLPVPANSELVIEGEIPPGIEHREGPFGEWAGYYVSEGGLAPVIEVKAILHRDDPIILGGMPGPLPSDNTYFLSLYRSAAVWDELERAGVPGVQGVWEHVAGGSYLFMIVSIKQLYAGHAKQAGMVAAFCHSGAYSNRFVVVVDDDIDPTDTDGLIWALSTRMDPRTDMDVIDRGWASPAEPMYYPKGGTTTDIFNTRVVIDACRPWERRHTFPAVAAASPELRERVLAKWKDLFQDRKSVG